VTVTVHVGSWTCGVLSKIDLRVHGMVWFGDGSVTNIEGCGTILIKCKTSGHKALTRVYYTPHLTMNIVSLRQLDVALYKILLRDGLLKLCDRIGALVAKVRRGVNLPYILCLNINQLVCLVIQGSSPAWCWHVRYRHLNFQSLRHLAKEGMVSGLPTIVHVDQVCDSCLEGKQRQATFPSVGKYRVAERHELVYGDLCSPVTPAASYGKRYFFLLVDDASSYM
jgi:hypothetical protein